MFIPIVRNRGLFLKFVSNCYKLAKKALKTLISTYLKKGELDG